MKKALLLMLACLIAATPAIAGAEAISLREAVNRAISGNHSIKAARYEQEAARQGAAASHGRYWPSVYFESGVSLSNTPSRVFMMKLDEARINPSSDFSAERLNHPSARGDFRSALAVEQPLWDRQIATVAELAAKDAEAAETSLEFNRETIAFRVYNAYLEVRTARAARDMSEHAVADAREHSRLAAVREIEGMGLKSDVLRSASELSEAEQRLVTADNNLLIARLRLNQVIGGPQGESIDITEEPRLAEPSQASGALISTAFENRPELRAARKLLEKGELLVRQANNAYLPTLYAGATYQINDRDLPLGWDNDSWSLGINLRWEIFDGQRRSHDKRKAEFAHDAVAESFENARRDVALQVHEAVLRRQESKLRLVSARQALDAAQEGVRLVGKRFANGLCTMVELMDAESTLNRARLNMVEMENNDLRSTAQIHYATGQFLQEVMR